MSKPKGKGWFKLGEVGVDSGQLMITDPCYLRNFRNDEAPGHDILLDKVTGIRWQFCLSGEPEVECTKMPGSYDSLLPGTTLTFNDAIREGRLEKLPDPPASNDYSYRGCCELTCGPVGGGGMKYDMGHMGQGVAFRSGYGDGVYDVWGRKNSEGRIVEVRVIMD